MSQQENPKKPLRIVKKYFRRKPSIQEVVREPTAGGIIFRRGSDGKPEYLMLCDAKGRWTIPKGHIEPGESAKQTAAREIGEEVGLHNLDMLGWLGKIHFRYRRINRLVLMTTQIYLVRAKGDTDNLKTEDWITDVRWFSFNDALDSIEYEDIEKLIMLAQKRIRQENL